MSAPLGLPATRRKASIANTRITKWTISALQSKTPVTPLNLISARRTLSNTVDIADSVIHICLTMKTATVRDLRNRFPRVAAWIDEGEPVEITKSGKPFARLVPAAPEKPRRFKMPDIKARLERTFGDSTYDAADIARGLAASRGELS
jgi:prevent-host-death family protein